MDPRLVPKLISASSIGTVLSASFTSTVTVAWSLPVVITPDDTVALQTGTTANFTSTDEGWLLGAGTGLTETTVLSASSVASYIAGNCTVTAAANDDAFIAITVDDSDSSGHGDTAIWYYEEAATADTVDAAELTLLAVVDEVNLSAGDFAFAA